jgi:hypothetical protein
VAKEEDFIQKLVVCVGYTTLVSGKKGISFSILDDDTQALTEEAFHLPRAKMKAEIGQVYEVPMTPDLGKMRTSEMRYLRVWAGDDLPFWRVRADEVLARERAESMNTQGKADALRQAMEVMGPIKVAYRSTDRWGRIVIEALVLEYLRNPS